MCAERNEGSGKERDRVMPALPQALLSLSPLSESGEGRKRFHYAEV